MARTALKLLSVTESSEKLGVARQRILQWISEKRIPAIRVGHQWAIYENECIRPDDMREK